MKGLELDSVESEYETVHSGCLNSSQVKTVKWGSVLGKIKHLFKLHVTDQQDALWKPFTLCTKVEGNRECMLQTKKLASCLGTERSFILCKKLHHPHKSTDYGALHKGIWITYSILSKLIQ